MVRVKQGGTYRIVTSVLPLAIYPSEIVEATARLFAFLENLKPRKTTGDAADGSIPTASRGDSKVGRRGAVALHENAVDLMAGRIGARVYRSSEWKRLRLAALQAANWRCARCRRYGNEAHHKVPLHLGGPELPDLSGLEVLCQARVTSNNIPHGGAPEWGDLLTRVIGG